VDTDLDAIRRYDDLTVLTVRGSQDVDVLLGIGGADSQVLEGLVAASLRPDGGVPGSELIGLDQPGPGLRIAQTTSPRPDLKVGVPSFNVEAEHDLLELPSPVFGLGAVASSPGLFSALSPTPLQVGQAKQKVLARFFATGFEAAAVTAMAMTRAAMISRQERRLELTFDRPFAFTAVLRESRLPIVAGWVERPTEPGE
jgi:hypothetical protein